MEADDAERRLEAMFRDHSLRLYRLALRMTGGSADAEDAVQEVFVRAARHVQAIPRERQRAGAWLVKTLIHVERDRRRRQRVRRKFSGDGSMHDATASSTVPDPAAGAALREALAAIPARRRAILLLNALEGRTVPEIAGLLGVKQVTVRWHLMQARRSLRPILRG